jgi:hypothetical protein
VHPRSAKQKRERAGRTPTKRHGSLSGHVRRGSWPRFMCFTAALSRSFTDRAGAASRVPAPDARLRRCCPCGYGLPRAHAGFQDATPISTPVGRAIRTYPAAYPWAATLASPACTGPWLAPLVSHTLARETILPDSALISLRLGGRRHSARLAHGRTSQRRGERTPPRDSLHRLTGFQAVRLSLAASPWAGMESNHPSA